MCNMRVEMTLMPDAPCSPASSRSLWRAGNLIFASTGDDPPHHVQSVIGVLSGLERRLKVRAGGG